MDLSIPIDQFLDSELGSDCTFTDVSESSASSIRVIFYDPYALNVIDSVTMEGANPYADCKTTDVSAAAVDDTLLINTVTYKVKEIQPGDDGFTRLMLYKANT